MAPWFYRKNITRAEWMGLTALQKRARKKHLEYQRRGMRTLMRGRLFYPRLGQDNHMRRTKGYRYKDY